MAVVKKGDQISVEPRSDLLRTVEVRQKVADAIHQLHGNLAVATELTEKLGDEGRAGIFRAMCATMDFLESQGIPRAAMFPFTVVAQAIVDADRGVATPAFAPSPTKGRPPVPLAETTTRSLTAVIAECCIRQKKLDGANAFKTDGLRDAALLLRKNGWGNRSLNSLSQMREDVTGRAKGDPIRDLFELMMDSALAVEHPRAYALALAQHGFVNQLPSAKAVGGYP